MDWICWRHRNTIQAAAWLLETTVKGGMSFERIVIRYGPLENSSASSGFSISVVMAGIEGSPVSNSETLEQLAHCDPEINLESAVGV